MTARALMFQGTGSDVGKSLIVAGLCRALTRRGLRVRAVQAAEHVEQRRRDGRRRRDRPRPGLAGARLRRRAERSHEPGAAEAAKRDRRPGRRARPGRRRRQGARVPGLEAELHAARARSFHKLRREADLVLVEGAGSAAEINLREGDIANMGFARAGGRAGRADRRHRPRRRHRADRRHPRRARRPQTPRWSRGFLVNKFRGDPALFDDGMRRIAARTGWPSFGLVPHFADAASAAGRGRRRARPPRRAGRARA